MSTSPVAEMLGWECWQGTLKLEATLGKGCGVASPSGHRGLRFFITQAAYSASAYNQMSGGKPDALRVASPKRK